MSQKSARTTRLASGLAVIVLCSSALAAAPALRNDLPRRAVAPAVVPESVTTDIGLDTLTGRSRKVLFRLVGGLHDNGVGILRRLFGDSAATHPGIYPAPDSVNRRPFSFITLVPFSAKVQGRLGAYRMGSWPGERRRSIADEYRNPDGFIKVTTTNQDTPVSAHFRLRDFLTHDQQAVWPKYLVLNERLLDKLELGIVALERRGIDAEHVVVMSGFRTPQYNAKGVGPGGRAADSRHQYGDAADVFVDSNGDGRMDDLNHDGRVNTNDARYLASVMESVERENGELVGGLGVYAATRAHGPFVHVDVRGYPARWGLW